MGTLGTVKNTFVHCAVGNNYSQFCVFEMVREQTFVKLNSLRSDYATIKNTSDQIFVHLSFLMTKLSGNQKLHEKDFVHSKNYPVYVTVMIKISFVRGFSQFR